MPFADKYLDEYHIAFVEAAHAHGYLCERLDFENYIGDVIDEIFARIRDSAGVVALLNDNNPNVFLEVGYAWGKGIPTILIMHEDSQMPFDVRGQKILRYQRLGELKGMLTQEIKDLFG